MKEDNCHCKLDFKEFLKIPQKYVLLCPKCDYKKILSELRKDLFSSIDEEKINEFRNELSLSVHDKSKSEKELEVIRKNHIESFYSSCIN